MPNYQNGKIYALRSYKNDQIYIGSTTQPLSNRMSEHRKHYKRHLNNDYPYVSSFEIMKYDDCYIELVELFPCDSKEELFKREGEIIRSTQNCINMRIAGRSQKEYYQDNLEVILDYHKRYAEENKEKIKEYKKQYQIENSERIKEYKKQYRIENRDMLLEKSKEYRENNKESVAESKKKCYNNNKEHYTQKSADYYKNNKDRILERNQAKFICECGCEITNQSRWEHRKSQKHASLMEEKKNIIVANEKVVE